MTNQVAKNNAKLPDIKTLIEAGIDPKTRLPLKFKPLTNLSENILKNLRVLDETQKVNLYKWYNLPSGLNGRLLERVLYYKGQGIFFYNDLDGNFYFLPFALDGDIDVYGRYLGVTPLPFNGTAKDKDDAWIVGFKRYPQYDIFDKDIMSKDTYLNGCVILKDYTQQISQTILPRATLQDSIMQMMSEAIPFARTSLISNSGVKAMRVQDESDASEVETASNRITHAALTGYPFIPVKSPVEFQDLTSAGSAMKSEEYLLYYQALDNLRKSFLGIPTGGVFEKKSHILQDEQNMNATSDQLILRDGLQLRQEFCQMVNAIWGLGIWVEKNVEDDLENNDDSDINNEENIEKGETEDGFNDNEQSQDI